MNRKNNATAETVALFYLEVLPLSVLFPDELLAILYQDALGVLAYALAG